MRFSLIFASAFSFCLIFGSGEISEINDDLIVAMQKISGDKKEISVCEKSECEKGDLEKRVCKLESKANEKPVFPKCDCCNDFGLFLETDFLYWLVKNENGFYFGKSAFGDDFNNEVITPKNNYKPGFRVGLGYNLPHDNWDIYLDWTWIKSTAFLARNAKNYALIEPNLFSDTSIAVNESPLTNTFSLTPVNFVKSKSGVKYNTWDFEIGKIFYPGSYLSLRPFIGVRGAWVKQVFERFATSPLAGISLDSTVFPLSEKIHEKFWGVGIRTGLNSQWNFCKSFGLYGNFSASLLYCKFDIIHSSLTEMGSAFETENRIERKSKRFEEIKPTMQAALGLSWNECFCNSVLFGLKAGYEINYFWDCVNSYDVSLLQEVNKALELSGLTVGMKIEF